jgi:hypothetical protein
MTNNYFFSNPDTDFKPTGSRDPLGLQMIWQEAGNHIIPYLSTVSNSIRDFKILCLAHTYFGDDLDRNIFIRFEQVCAYVRYNKYEKEAFNGIEKVRKRSSSFPVTISASEQHTLLTAQIPYGVWGKYNRPFLSMLLGEHFDFPKLSKSNEQLFKHCRKSEFKLTKEMIEECDFLNLTEFDKRFFSEQVLQLSLGFDDAVSRKNQNELYQLISNNDTIQNVTDFFILIELLQEKATNELKEALENIKQTEKVITPLNRIFKHLQTKNIWKINQEFSDLEKYIEAINPIDYQFKNKATTDLQQILNTKDTWQIIQGLARINSRVSKNRGKSPWVIIEENKLVLNEKSGAARIKFWESKADNDFQYFFNTYRSLFHQVQTI